MKRRTMKGFAGFVLLLLAAISFAQAPDISTTSTQGSLLGKTLEGKILEIPLKHTSVHAGIAGYLAEVEVRQYFHNPYKEKIEAVYVFPLPENAAVSEMLMIVGSRTIYGEIKKRQEARQIYETARAAGKRTALLEQERPNIFTQSVANIQPDEDIIISIWFVQPLKFDFGVYSYVFPMVVGPRFIPGAPTGASGTGIAPDTDKVPDASRITPPVLPPEIRSGHDISLSVDLEAGLPVNKIWSKSHDVEIETLGISKYRVALKEEDSIPNKDFILEYNVTSPKVKCAVIPHKSQIGGYFMIMLQPDVEGLKQAQENSKEIFFVIDASGSMSGFPIMKCKKAAYCCIRGISPADTFQIIRFSSSASTFSPHPLPSTLANKEKALEYIAALQGEGGTMMIEGIKACLDYPKTEGRQRIVFFMTDGYIGNDNEILAAIKERVGDTKLFSFGIGSSVNRSLLEQMAQLGNGTAQFIRQDEPADKVMNAMMARISKPYLSDIALEWKGIEASDITPRTLPTLYSAQPLVFFGRYEKSGEGTLTVRGNLGGEPFEQSVPVQFPEWEADHASLPLVWARHRIMDLTQDKLGEYAPHLEKEITELALDYHLMSQYTSLVAVDDEISEGGDSTLPRIISVPVPIPEGVSYEGVFGRKNVFTLSEDTIARNYAYFEGASLGKSQAGIVASSMPSRATAVAAPSVSEKKLVELKSSIQEIDADKQDMINSFRDGDKRTDRSTAQIQEIRRAKAETNINVLEEMVRKSEDVPASAALESLAKIKGKDISIPLLKSIILEKNAEKYPLTVQRAAYILYKYPANAEQKKEIHQIFLKTLAVKYPETAGNPPTALRRSLRLAALSGLEGYAVADAFKPFMTLARDDDKDVRIQAILRLAGYPEAQEFLYSSVFAADDYLDKPEVMAAAASALRKGKYQEKARERARDLLFKKKTPTLCDCEIARIAMTELILDDPESVKITEIVSLLREDKSWRVRRAILSRLASKNTEKLLVASRIALDDPQPYIRQIAIASVVAITAKPMERKEYLKKLSATPTPLTCAEIFKAENISPDISLLPRGKVREILQNRGMAIQ